MPERLDEVELADWLADRNACGADDRRAPRGRRRI